MKRLSKILPHITIILAGMFIVFWILDILNPTMNFINRKISNKLPLALKWMIKNEEGGKGEISSFAALCTALSATSRVLRASLMVVVTIHYWLEWYHRWYRPVH